MRCPVALLAESAAVTPDGRLDVRGGAVATIAVDTPARLHAWLVLVVEFGDGEVAREHRLYVDVIDGAGVPMGFRMSRPVRVPAATDGPALVPITVPVSVIVEHHDVLTVRARIGSVALADVALRVEPSLAGVTP